MGRPPSRPVSLEPTLCPAYARPTMTAAASPPLAAPAPLRTRSLEERLAGTPYDAYLYGYPHKTAYRELSPARALSDVWSGERKDALFLYLHVPFCEMRCGFCNLFTTPDTREDRVSRYLDVLERQARIVRAEIGPGAFSRMAIGGGTPTLLDPAGLERVLDVAEGVFGVAPRAIPVSVETSPETCTPDKMRLLARRGVDRVSIGVQSFVEAESAAVKRPQRLADVERAIDAIRDAGVPTLNVDLMYGLPGQTPDTWRASLEKAVALRAEELYLYPLYVRPVTTLSRRPRDWDDERLALYRQAVTFLKGAGYKQLSMRMFRAAHAPGEEGPVYCVQEDGMVGLGVGARSYTRALHYASDWAVGARGVLDIVDRWLDSSDADLARASHGFELDGDEQRRRHVALGLFVDGGLDLARYRARFGTDAATDLPLGELVRLGVAREERGVLFLTELGLERSDVVGPWLFSDRVQALMRGFDLR